MKDTLWSQVVLVRPFCSSLKQAPLALTRVSDVTTPSKKGSSYEEEEDKFEPKQKGFRVRGAVRRLYRQVGRGKSRRGREGHLASVGCAGAGV